MIANGKPEAFLIMSDCDEGCRSCSLQEVEIRFLERQISCLHPSQTEQSEVH